MSDLWFEKIEVPVPNTDIDLYILLDAIQDSLNDVEFISMLKKLIDDLEVSEIEDIKNHCLSLLPEA